MHKKTMIFALCLSFILSLAHPCYPMATGNYNYQQIQSGMQGLSDFFGRKAREQYEREFALGRQLSRRYSDINLSAKELAQMVKRGEVQGCKHFTKNMREGYIFEQHVLFANIVSDKIYMAFMNDQYIDDSGNAVDIANIPQEDFYKVYSKVENTILSPFTYDIILFQKIVRPQLDSVQEDIFNKYLNARRKNDSIQNSFSERRIKALSSNIDLSADLPDNIEISNNICSIYLNDYKMGLLEQDITIDGCVRFEHKPGTKNNNGGTISFIVHDNAAVLPNYSFSPLSTTEFCDFLYKTMKSKVSLDLLKFQEGDTIPKFSGEKNWYDEKFGYNYLLSIKDITPLVLFQCKRMKDGKNEAAVYFILTDDMIEILYAWAKQYLN